VTTSDGNLIIRPSKPKLSGDSGQVSIRPGRPFSISLEGYVYLVVDCSGSMAGNKLEQAKKGAQNFARDALSKGYSIGLIRFDSGASIVCVPIKDISKLKKSLEALEAGDSTNMTSAIQMAHHKLKINTGARAMVIVTDGMPDNPESSLQAGESAKKDGIDIIAIGTDDANRAFLEKIASRAELGKKVTRDEFSQAITESSRMLPYISTSD
jgi:molecular chaperone DnaK